MALIACGQCGRHIADHVPSCPSCGRPLRPVSSTDPPGTASYHPGHVWYAVGIAVVVAVVLLVLMEHLAARQEAQRAHQAQVTALQADRKVAQRVETELQRLQGEARAGGGNVPNQ